MKYISERKVQFFIAFIGTFFLTYLLYLDDPTFMSFSENTFERLILHILVLLIFLWAILLLSNKWAYQQLKYSLGKQMNYKKYKNIITIYLFFLTSILLIAIITRIF